jgi:type III pantothenate kinase
LESDPIYLLVDAGNSRVKWGVHDGRGWVARGAVPTAEVNAIGEAWSGLPRIARATASNVAGVLVAEDLQRACRERGIALTIIRSQAKQLGVTNGYRDPSQLGADRWAALIGAHHVEPGHKLVVTAGTALTIDALAADGRFLGGSIVPGAALMRRSLDRGTAGLRFTEGTFADFPAATADAIATGSIDACVGAIGRVAQRMQAGGCGPARIVLSGGAAQEIAPHLPMAHAFHENLVLDGLALIARETA